MNEVGYERTWQECRVRAKNIVSNYRKITRSSKMYTLNELSFFSSCRLFAFFTANYCIQLYSSTQHVTKAKFLFYGHVNVMLSKVQLNTYESVVLWQCERTTESEFAFECEFVESGSECAFSVNTPIETTSGSGLRLNRFNAHSRDAHQVWTE